MNVLPSSLSQEKCAVILAKAQYAFAAQVNGIAETATTQEVSEYFDVLPSEVMTTLERHWEEFEKDLVEDDWSPRAILRLGMLLNCPVARLIRDTVLKIVDAIAATGIKDKIKSLFSDINFVGWSNREIARLLECGKDAVRRTRQEMETSGEIPTTKERLCRRGETTYQQTHPLDLATPSQSRLVAQEEKDDCLVEKEAEVELSHFAPPRLFTQEEVDQAIVLAVRDALVAHKVQLEEAALESVQERLVAAQRRAENLQDKNVQLQSALEHLQGLKSLEVENHRLKQEIQRLEKAIEIAPVQQWADKNLLNRAAAKALNKEVTEFLEKLEPDLHLRIMATTPPSEEFLGTALDLLSQTMTSLIPIALQQYRDVLPVSKSWADFEGVANRWSFLKMNIWNQLTGDERARIRSLRQPTLTTTSDSTPFAIGQVVSFLGDQYQAQYGCTGRVVERVYGNLRIEWVKPDGSKFVALQSPEELRGGEEAA